MSGDGTQRTTISADEDVFINLDEREARVHAVSCTSRAEPVLCQGHSNVPKCVTAANNYRSNVM